MSDTRAKTETKKENIYGPAQFAADHMEKETRPSEWSLSQNNNDATCCT